MCITFHLTSCFMFDDDNDQQHLSKFSCQASLATDILVNVVLPDMCLQNLFSFL